MLIATKDISNGLFNPHRLMFGSSYCVPCCMSIPHLQCYSSVSPDIQTAILKTMSDKLQQPTSNPWAFQGHQQFGYDDQSRHVEGQEFDGDASRQSAAPFMHHFLPRIGLPFTDFTDYQRFNGFQRGAFFPTPFGSHLPNPPYPFPLNHPVDTFGIPHAHTLMPNSLPPLHPTEKPKTDEDDHNDKPPVLLAEYPVKQELDLKFDPLSDFPVIPKEEPTEDGIDKKKDGFGVSSTTDKSFESTRSRDDILVFNPQFYSQPLDMGLGSAFKQEMSTVNPPTVDTHPTFHKFDADVKRPEFPPPTALHDCQVCLSTHANGLHFGARTCAACAAFFRRTISDDKRYVCKRNQRCTNASRDGTGYRKICRSCRMKRCLDIGMLPENVQHKRNRRDSGSPPRKTPFDTFFTGFYPGFPPTTTTSMPPMASINLPPTDPHHPNI